MSATSPTSGLSTPVHLSSDSLVNQGAPNHYPASEQLDFDEAIDIGDDHVTTADGGGGVADNGHVTQRMKLSLSDESTEEGRDSVPNYESTTTDNIIDSFEPVDYIESNPRLHTGSEIRYHANGGLVGNHGNGAGPSLPYHRYENWSVLDQIDDGSKKSRVVKRNKGSRVAKVERQRAPYPLPRPGKVKSIHSRPSPLSRKRRYSGRVVRPPLQPANASEETDMAQADEMGEGEGRDDGFIDGAMQEPFKRRSKKRTGGIHSLLPSLGHGSPQSSPSTTPVSRRKISTRKSRLKPRTRRHSKPQLASADISTQESTTQGPCSSDTSEARASQDEVDRPGPGGGGGGGGGEDLGSDSDGDYEDTRSITPNPRDVGVVRAELVKLRNGGIPSLAHRDQVSDIQPPPVTVMSSKDDSLGGSASDNNLRHDSNETSDTDLTPLPRTDTLQHWANKKFESDLSTAPFSSETSDMETSGNERVFTTDGGSATDLNPKPSPDSPPIPSSSPSPMGKVSTRQILSGSSGDEVKKNKLSVKSKPISKPSPPPKKVSTVEPSSAGKPSSSAGKPSSSAGKPSSSAGKPSSSAGKPSSSAGKPSAVVKKPLHATKSSPLGNKVTPAPQKSQKSEGSNNPSRSKSIKVNIPAKPKPPPVPAKPASKPDVKPKPMRSTSVHHSPSRSGHTSSQKAKFEGKPRANSVQEPESSVPVMRKIHSENDLGAAKVVVRRSPTMAARKLTLVKEETAERRQSTPPRPNPPSAPLKPTVPLKPRRQQQQPSEGKAKPGEKASEKKGKSIESAQSAKQSKELPPSDSSKTVSSSEVTTSGPSQSPSVSPYTSPNLSKRLSASGSRPALLPKKASVKSHHHRANSDSARLLRKVEPFDIHIGSSASVVSVVSSTTPNSEQSTKEGVKKGESKRSVRSSNMSPEMPASPTDGATSPPPPPIPPRSKVAGRKSSHLELVIPVSDPGSVRSSPTPTDSIQRKKLGAPRRPPPSPPSPLPKRATEAQPTSNELIDSNSRMSQSNFRDQPQRPVSMHGRDIHSTRIEDAPPVGPIHQYAVVNKPRAFKISPEKPRSKTPDFLSRDKTAIDSDIRKNSDSELEVHSTKKRTKVVRRESSRRAPPKPPKYDTPDETTGYVPVNTDTMSSQQQKLGSQSPRSRSSVSPLGDETVPPPLPAQPIPKRKMSLQKPTSTVSERPRLKDPIYDVIPDLPKKTYKKAKHREYEEIDLIDGELPPGLIKSAKETPTKEAPTESVKSVSESPVEPIKSPVELVRTVSEALPHKQTQKQPQGNYAHLPIEDLRENWKTSPQMRRRAAKSFSCKKSQSLMFRRFSSERLAQRSKLLTIDASPSRRKSLLHRTPSLDRLDDRMGRSLRYSMHYCQDSSSSDEEDMTGIASPVSAALPKPPSDKSLYSSPKSPRTKQGKSVGGAGYFVPPDVEPLYQYINTAEFLRETSDPMIPPPPPSSSSSTSMANRLPVPPGVPGAPGQPKQNQLEIARQLSQRKLWCEQPEVITSGILMSLSDEEKKLQEAMFEVISSEATYLRSLDVLIDHFMDDPGMNPNLPEGRRVLDKRQHHVIFSNVREVRDVSARFLSDLELRQKESPVVKNISDIILDYAENHFECYVRYCTNQIYQTRELHDCIENNVMFREYLKRLESKKICQNLNMQSFLLLPMQRITRLPLLILAILNRTPLDYPDQSLVESTLRNVQKLVTACNDGARKMERTEQLHEIHKKLYFGKLKPFPLVSVSRQLERRGTLALLQVEQKLFGKRKITKKPLYLFVFTDYVIIAKKKKDPKGDYLYKVVDHASRALVEVENVETLSGMTFPKPVLGDQDPITEAMWAVSVAGSKHAFLLMLLDNVHRQTARYLLLASNDTDKTRWLDSLSRQDVEREDEKIYQTWDCPQVQAVFDYKAQQPDELDLQRGDVVKVYRKMADGWYEGEKLRDFQCGWFPSNFTMEIQNEHTRARNLRETHRLNSLLAANDMILSCVQQNPR